MCGEGDAHKLHAHSQEVSLLSRNVVCSVRECFYRPDTWEDCDKDIFLARAQSCALQSLHNLHHTAEDAGEMTSSPPPLVIP